MSRASRPRSSFAPPSMSRVYRSSSPPRPARRRKRWRGERPTGVELARLRGGKSPSAIADDARPLATRVARIAQVETPDTPLAAVRGAQSAVQGSKAASVVGPEPVECELLDRLGRGTIALLRRSVAKIVRQVGADHE